jgi:peptidoglycan hydrolase CwlO-like protein
MTKDMKVNLAILVSFLTIMSMVVAGGIAFGTVKEGIQAQDEKIKAMQYRADELAKQTYEINAKISEVATDLRWIRIVIEEYAKSTKVQAELSSDRLEAVK